jgi:hypothetical protein
MKIMRGIYGFCDGSGGWRVENTQQAASTA